MKRVYLAALTGQTDPQSNEEVQGEFCISTLAVSANISNSYSSHNHQFKQLYVSTSYFDLSPLCPDLLEDPKCDTMTGNLMIRDNLAPKLRRSSVPVHSDGRAHRGLTKNEPPAPKLTPVIVTEVCSCTCFLAKQGKELYGHNDRSWWGSNPRSQTAAKWTQFGQGETELWQMLLVKGTKYASITVSLCGLERIQNKVIKDLCCRIIPPVKKPNMTITSMPNVWAQL